MASLQFPLSDQDKYKGRIKFDVIRTIPPTINQRAVRKVQESVLNSDNSLQGNEADPDLFDPRGPGQRGATASYINKSRDVPTGERCSIYLPQSIQIQDGVQIENVDLGVFGASLEAGMKAGTSPIEAAISAAGETFSSMADFFRGNLSQDAARAAAARLAGVAGDTRAAAVRSALQTTPAPNTRAIFKSVNIREFSFTFNMLPKTRREAIEIESIIKLFRQELYPETIDIGGIPVAYKFPNKFAISIQYDGKEVATKILNSYLRNFQTNYNPNAMAFYEGGHFQETQITMSFVEARTLDKKDIEGGF
tara:strand:- start:1163 stop:2086 length:924 start_codon:yes stop_codon:yes gene_type:complete